MFFKPILLASACWILAASASAAPTPASTVAEVIKLAVDCNHLASENLCPLFDGEFRKVSPKVFTAGFVAAWAHALSSDEVVWDGDLIAGCQNCAITDGRVGAVHAQPNGTVAVTTRVGTHNDEDEKRPGPVTRQKIVFMMKNEDSAWKIDDIIVFRKGEMPDAARAYLDSWK